MRMSVATAVACLLVTSVSAADRAQAAIRRYVDIPTQQLGSALAVLAKEQHFQLLYRSEVVENRNTAGARGNLSREEALEALLQGTGLTYQFVDESTVSIIPIAAMPKPPVSVKGAGKSDGKLTMAEEAQKDTRLWGPFRVAQVDQGEATTEGSVDGSDTASREQPARLEEIVVTAQKRTERLQDVPISITAITAEEIERRGVVSSGDYLRGIPGVTQSEAGRSGQAIVIRGMESTTNGQNFASGPTTATYFGETPTSTSAGLTGGSSIDVLLVDIERVEVLRGPQGTAFGNSSMGGAVRIIPAAPRLDRFEGRLASGYSVTSGSGGDNYHLQGVANIPIVADRFAVRAVAYRYDDSGFYRNRAGSDTGVFKTSLIDRYGLQSFAHDVSDSGSEAVNGGRVAALFQANDDLSFTLSYLRQKSERNGPTGAGIGTFDYVSTLVRPEHMVRGRSEGVTDRDLSITNATMEYALKWADLIATYSYLDSENIATQGFNSNTLLWPASYKSVGEHIERVAEIRLTTRFDGPWNFLVGVFHENSEDSAPQEYLWLNQASTTFFNANGRFDRLGNRLDTRDLEQRSAFTEISWKFADGFTLTAGARAYEYDRDAGFFGTGAFYGVVNEQGTTRVSDSNFKGNLSYQPHEDALFYAGWAQGFRLGRPQGGLPNVCDSNQDGIADVLGIPIDSTRAVNPDSVDSYELGGKLLLLDRRLQMDAAAFRMEWQGVPFRISGGGSGTNCPFTFNANAGNALSEGVEFQLRYQLAEPLRLDVGGSWINARITEDVLSGSTFLARKDDRLPGSPEVNANLSLQYEFDLFGRQTFIRADSIYVGEDYATVNETPGTESGDYVKLDLSTRLNLGDLYMDIFVRNVTNEDAFTARHIITADPFAGYRLRPRTFGVQLGYSFD